jgi:hypothetical protein
MSNPNQFRVVGGMPLEDIEAGLRAAPLLETRDVFPFADADISFEWMTQDEFSPTSLLVVERKLAIQSFIATAMKADVGFDQYELADGGVILEGGPEGTKGVIPPVIVDAKGLDGVSRAGVLDGIHRAFQCFEVEERDHLFVARVTGASSDWQAYAYTNGWGEIDVVEEKPPDKRLWKHYVGDPLKNEEYALYVDFGHLNGSRPYVPGEGADSTE